MIDLSRLYIFASLVCIIYLLAFINLIMPGREIIKHFFVLEKKSEQVKYVPEKVNWFRRIIFGLVVLELICAAYSFYEPYRPEIVHTILKSSKIKKRIRLVHISDLHSEAKVRLENKLPAIIADLKPDVCFFTGDAINEDEGVDNFRRCLKGITSICPTFVVKGNWEAWWFRHANVFKGTGVVELNGNAHRVHIRGNDIWVSGAAVERESLIPQALNGVPADKFSIFLHHFPALWTSAARGGADLHLAGDTHGGQVVIPFLGPLVRIKRHDGKFYKSGLQKMNGMWLYVNRGIGLEGGRAPRIRFLCRPEIAVIDLIAAKG